MIADSIFALLSADPGVAAIAGTRIYPMVLPDDAAFPAITYQQVGGSSTPTMDTSGVQKLRLQIDCWSAPLPLGGTYRQASGLRDAVRRALDGYSGVLGDGTQLSRAWIVNPGMDFFAHEALQYRCMLEFYLLYTFTD